MTYMLCDWPHGMPRPAYSYLLWKGFYLDECLLYAVKCEMRKCLYTIECKGNAMSCDGMQVRNGVSMQLVTVAEYERAMEE